MTSDDRKSAEPHATRIEQEIATYRDAVEIHNLPEIFHYWSHTYLAPDLREVFGSDNLHGIFASEIRESIDRSGIRAIVSVGAGDASVECSIAAKLREAQFDNFQFDCLELSPHLISRGEAAIRAQGLERHVRFLQVDLTEWTAKRPYGAAFAHHSLHHIVALEHVFDELVRAMAPGAAFVVSDMIGRNGHMRWPETEELLQRLWKTMPARYRYDHQLGVASDHFVNFDCSNDGFEGVRAQDIMPELLKRFYFRKYVAWGGLTDVFVDRSFGHNLSPDSDADRAFIDHLAAADRALLLAGAATPTNVIAVMTKEAGGLVANGLDPWRSVHR